MPRKAQNTLDREVSLSYVDFMKACELFDLRDIPDEFRNVFKPDLPAWEWLKALPEVLNGRQIVHPSCDIHPSAVLEGPVYIESGVRVGPGVYLRGPVVALRGAVLGHGGEFKNCILLQGATAAHYNYVGDSILGHSCHLAAGVICANLRLDAREVKVAGVPTGLAKLGAMVGDGAQVGCNSVLNPGTVLMKAAMVGPLEKVKGIIQA